MAEPVTTVDDLLSAAARAHPRKTAIRADYGDITYGEIDRAATMCAAALRGLLGEERCVIAVASPPHPDFMVGFYGIIRSGNIAAPINPLLPPHILHHLLSSSGARLAFVTSDLFTQLRGIRDRLPRLREAVLVGPGPVSDANDIRTIDDLSAAYEVRGNAMAPPPALSADDVACVQFTSGTTGLPRGVLLSHRNLTVNAAQVAEAHGLGPDSVVLNHLPKFHLMHMNGVVHAGAVHVPCTAPEDRAAVEAANDARASHFYTIPMKLNRLAADPELPNLRLDTVRMIASGGSALPPRVGTLLAEHFGIPVFQGYGLAETSPLTHSAGPEDPRPGSVGRTVRDTECRVVDLETRRVLPAGGRGEVLVRGPQVMKGYLDPDEPTGIDADGWLATGDIGYVDEDGFLHVVDRIKDLFTCDNNLVSPAEIETLLDAHPLVRESAVVGYPDGTSGEVAHAFVALSEVPDDPSEVPAVLAGIAEEVNRDLPYYQRVRHVEAADALPRSPNGKVPRRELRAELITRRELTVRPAGGRGGGGWRPGVVDEARDLSGLVTAVGRFTAKGDPKDFEMFFLEHVEFMRAQEGFVSQHAVHLADDPSVYLNFGWWTDQQAFLRVVRSAEFRAHQATMRSMLEDAEVDACKNLFRVRPPRPAGETDEALAPLVEVTSYRLTGSAEEFEAAFVEHARSTRTLPGFGYADLSRSLQGSGRYTGIAYWWDAAARDRAVEGAAWRRLRRFAEVRTERVEHVARSGPAGPSGTREDGR
ncbi:AMP-binding protein [Streptomyces sp. NPDC102283]|uniref:AMP-binding protein n=1 Tax=Streptomyces sp. NPDC102283 TaxID=3366155 RepID=UPI003828DA7B